MYMLEDQHLTCLFIRISVVALQAISEKNSLPNLRSCVVNESYDCHVAKMAI